MMEAEIIKLPVFVMPSCSRHFFKGYKWWCRSCSNEVESQFREICKLYWTIKALEADEKNYLENVDQLKEALQIPTLGTDGIMTQEEYRRRIGLPPLKDDNA